MDYKQGHSLKFLGGLSRKPLSSLTALLAGAMIGLSVYQLSIGNIYLEQLNWIDASTLIMVGVLLLRGVVSRQLDTDLQTVSIALIGALSFAISYEAIFKLSFYTFPWRMPSAELREFVIQVGVALTALAGFAFGKFKLSVPSLIFAGIFVIGWIVWLLVGFPQLDNGQNFYPPVINVTFSWDMIYALNRATKIALGLVYYFFYA